MVGRCGDGGERALAQGFGEGAGGNVFFNPGSAGPRRFSLPVTVGFVTVADGVEASIKELAVA